MKNTKESEDKLLKEWFRQMGAQPPKEGFRQSILANLKPYPTVGTIYEPLISPLVMKWIGAVLFALFVGILLLTPYFDGTPNYWDQINAIDTPKLISYIPKFHLPKIQLGPVFNLSLLIYSILFISFLLTFHKKWKLH